MIMTSNTIASSPKVVRSRRWLRAMVIALGVFVLAALGALIAYLPHATDNEALKSALAHVESGGIPDEPPEYAAEVAKDLQAVPPAQVIPATYSTTNTFNDVTYNAVLSLRPDGSYDYALTVGNSRVFKLYKHTGKWWVEGKVLHTILLEGDDFLTAASARDRKTPARERIIESSADVMVLQAHYGPQVHFKKID